MSSTVGSYNLYIGQLRPMAKVCIVLGWLSELLDQQINRRYLAFRTGFLFVCLFNHLRVLEPPLFWLAFPLSSILSPLFLYPFNFKISYVLLPPLNAILLLLFFLISIIFIIAEIKQNVWYLSLCFQNLKSHFGIC